jgi:hypothetical protein
MTAFAWRSSEISPFNADASPFRNDGDVTMETVEAYPHNPYRTPGDFVYSVSRHFVRACQTPMLIMPDDVPASPYAVCMEVAALTPKADTEVHSGSTQGARHTVGSSGDRAHAGPRRRPRR